MSRHMPSIAVLATAAVSAALAVRSAHGGLITSIYYQESARATDYTSGTPQTSTTNLTGTNYPLHQTLTAPASSPPNVKPGGLISTTYDFVDGPGGTTATYTIASLAQLIVPGQEVFTGSSAVIGPGTIFTLSAPAAFTATSTASVTGLLQLTRPTATLYDLDVGGVAGVVFMKGGDFTVSGTLAAGDRYQLSDGFGLSNSGLTTADAAGAGQRTLTLTLTAVPEPATAGLAAAAAAGVLARRCRRSTVVA